MSTIEKHMIIKKGMFFTVSDGEYSNYCINALCKALKDFDITELEKEYENVAVGDDYIDAPDEYGKRPGIVHWLVNIKGLAKDFNFCDFHIDYSMDGTKFYLD